MANISRAAKLELAIRKIAKMNASFLEQMPSDWEGDPLQDAISDAIRLVELDGLPPGYVEIITNGTRRIILADEPVFLLRARDKFAAGVVRHWAAVAQMGGVREEQIQIARRHADKMDAWPVKQIPGETRLAEKVC